MTSLDPDGKLPGRSETLRLRQAPRTVSRPELLKDGSDRAFREMVHGLLAFSSRLETVRQTFGAILGLSGIQFTLLISILHLQGKAGVGVKALADHLSLSGAFVTIEIGKLVKLGLIEKQINPEDRRRVLLAISDKGASLLSELAPVQADVNDVLFEPLSAESFNLLHDLSADLVESAERAVALSEYLSGQPISHVRKGDGK